MFALVGVFLTPGNQAKGTKPVNTRRSRVFLDLRVIMFDKNDHRTREGPRTTKAASAKEIEAHSDHRRRAITAWETANPPSGPGEGHEAGEQPTDRRSQRAHATAPATMKSMAEFGEAARRRCQLSSRVPPTLIPSLSGAGSRSMGRRLGAEGAAKFSSVNSEVFAIGPSRLGSDQARPDQQRPRTECEENQGGDQQGRPFQTRELLKTSLDHQFLGCGCRREGFEYESITASPCGPGPGEKARVR